MFEILLLKAQIHDISFEDIEKVRIKKKEKNGGFDKRIFLISTASEEYVEHNKGCSTCNNGSCKTAYDEKIGYEDDGKPAGYHCKGYKSVYKK